MVLASEVEAAAWRTYVETNSLEQPVCVADHRPYEDDNLPFAGHQVLVASAFHLHSDTAKHLGGMPPELQGVVNVEQVVRVGPTAAVAQSRSRLLQFAGVRHPRGAHVVDHPVVAVVAAACAEDEGASDLEAKVAPFQDTPQDNASVQTVDSSYASWLSKSWKR